VNEPPLRPVAERPGVQRFALVGLAATAVDVGAAISLVAVGWGRLPADVVALAAAAVFARLLGGRFTRRGPNLDHRLLSLPVFVGVSAAAAVVDLLVFVGWGSAPPAVAKLAAVAVAASIRTVAHRTLLHRVVVRTQGSPSRRPRPAGDRRLSVVVPAYGEADRIAETVATLRAELAAVADEGGLEILIVDDGSHDDTAAVARNAGADQVIELAANRGKGGAVRAGVLAASGRTIAFTDADLAYPPAQLIPMVERIEQGWDLVIGNRQHEDTRTLEGPSGLRSFGSRMVNMASHVLLLGNYRDTQCGCKVRRADVARLVMSAGSIDGFAFDIEMLHLAERYDLAVFEVPVEVVNSETSTVRAVRDGIGVMLDIWRIRWRARRGGYPHATDEVLAPASPAAGLDQ